MESIDNSTNTGSVEIGTTHLQAPAESAVVPRPCSAVVVRSAYKQYNQTAVLKDLNLTVPDGKIYGLLGPSGCGKTTLLSCIVGRIRLDSGEIKLKGKFISDIGYMPQELALHEELSIKETFIYYGYIFDLSRETIEKRARELKDLLELPCYSLVLSDLSGGQQRRVSLAVAMLHDPKLLILDEPTVGLDPLISQSIWELLIELTSKGKKTVIITTHYIEEAKQSHMIGLMRKGTLLSEATPTELLTSCDCSYLEEAFLKICQSHVAKTNSFKIPIKQPTRRFSYARDLPPPPLLNNKLFTFGRFKAQICKNFFLLTRNIPFTLFLVCLPIIQTAIFNITCGRDPEKLALGVFNEEISNGFHACSKVHVSSNGCFLDGRTAVSCLMLEKLKEKSFTLVEFSNIQDGRNAVVSNDVWAFIHFSSNFSGSLATKIVTGSDATNDTLTSSTIVAWVDRANKYISEMIQRDILDSYSNVIESILFTCGISKKIGYSPLQIQNPVYGIKNPSFIHYAAPAIIALCAFYLPAIYTAAAILSEKEGGVIERVVLSGMNFIEIALAHITVQILFIAIQTSLVMIVMFAIFQNPFVGDPFPVFVLLTLIGVGGMCFGMMWPIEGIHYLLRNVSYYLPLTLSTESLRSLTAKGLKVNHPSVYLGYMSILSWIVVFSLVSYLLLKIKRDVWTKT
ncbi:ABC transporter G family member 23-like isoform X2 [Daktulosphaira vitifoliae]|uniref:ABC transporter G family member 23-like isoform X2 n=1 Tax=Daktulosphaira vitifoliae TaxID=58002 RepID=UPI0021AA1FB7|nr:ABC transporter G family member 23-like isoform X2 [Daktulosphaira vitifoliae]